MGYVILESMIWFDLIWFDKLDIPNLTENNIHYGEESFYHTADLQATSIFLFLLFSRFRCSCSRKSHSRNVEIFEKLDKTAFLSLAGRRRRKSSSVVVEIVVCLIATNFNHSANPIAREFHPVWQMRKITLFFLFILSRISPIVANKQISNLFPHFSFSTILKSKRRNKAKQNKFKTFFANAVEISIISTDLIKITLSRIAIQKEWRLVSFCENC